MVRSKSKSRSQRGSSAIGGLLGRLKALGRGKSRRRGSSRKLWRRILDNVFYWISWPFLASLAAMRWTGQQIPRLWRTKQFRQLLWGMPFLLVMIGWCYLLIASSLKDPMLVEQDYNRAAMRAYLSRDLDAARLYTERVARNRPYDNELLFRLASIYALQSEPARSQSLMDRIAPLDRPVYAPAHLARAQQLLNRGIADTDLDSFQRAQTQLLQAAAADPKNPGVRSALGQIYFRLGWWSESEQNLRLAVDSMPELLLTLAKATGFQGKRDQAALFAQRAETYYQRRLAENPLDHETRLALGDALAFMERFDQSIWILQQGLTISERPEFHAALAKVYLLWSDTVGDRTAANRRRQLELLEQGLRHNPHDLEFFQHLLRLLDQEGDVSEEARSFLVNNLARGEGRLLSHLVLGTYEAERGRIEQAMLHLQQAHELNPNIYAVANNLALVLSEALPPQLDRAFALINAALEIHPKVPEMLDTRGQILTKKGQWRDAVRDLEAALPTLRGNMRLHQALSECYRNLGMAELADQHAAIADRLAKDTKDERPR